MLSSLALIAILVFGVLYIVRRVRAASGSSFMQRAAAGAAAPPDRTYANPQDSQHQPDIPAGAAPSAASGAFAPTPAAPVDEKWVIPGDFNTPEFLTQAKAQFVAIQAVWDSGDVKKLTDYLTDDLIAELKPQVLARDGTTQTEVVLLNAELLGIESVSGGHLASVRYSGMLRESKEAEAFRFEEVWNLYKAENAGWLLAGIQQIPLEFAS
jgi:predicted lipid-binding transport protein (Tim44 family)